ncbi:Fanconi anemia core complex-associated protein 24-like isoform X2 [Stegodyphus dumicola]|nr:Fanconi anemia core complex-associated protein 24-like isoform X2 [Stegodyphus dumicola]
MDFVDFFPASDFAVIYVTEADLIAGSNYKRNLAKLKNATYDRHAVIVEKTATSNQYFDSFQKFAVLELGLGIIPVSGLDECCHALVSMVRMGSEDKSNPFMMKRRVPPLETYLLKTLLTVPSVGETKAQALLLKFKSLLGICNASVEELEKVIGTNSAQQVYNFFRGF